MTGGACRSVNLERLPGNLAGFVKGGQRGGQLGSRRAFKLQQNKRIACEAGVIRPHKFQLSCSAKPFFLLSGIGAQIWLQVYPPSLLFRIAVRASFFVAAGPFRFPLVVELLSLSRQLFRILSCHSSYRGGWAPARDLFPAWRTPAFRSRGGAAGVYADAWGRG